MASKKPTNLKSKAKHHPRNRHRDGYDFDELKAIHTPLDAHVKVNKYGNESIDFFDPKAVKALNTALLIKYYGITSWEIPEGYLCPPIPGRADFIHHIADAMNELLGIKQLKNPQIRCLDIGTGANCIYPIIGNFEYGWSFVGSDILDEAIAAANAIIKNNKTLENKVEIRKQAKAQNILEGILKTDEYFDIAICNPPFHESKADAMKGSIRKIKNLTGEAPISPLLNFGGKHHELWYEGGEKIFIKRYIHESKGFAKNCMLFSSLVSKERNLEDIQNDLERANVAYSQVIKMGQGNKTSHIITWSFLNKKQLSAWSSRFG